jgi:hypothetical protein
MIEINLRITRGLGVIGAGWGVGAPCDVFRHRHGESLKPAPTRGRLVEANTRAGLLIPAQIQRATVPRIGGSEDARLGGRDVWRSNALPRR